MLRSLLLLPLLLAGCSKGADADLEYIKQARSLAAEWAMVNQQAAEGKLTAAYVSSMHEWLREQLQTSATSLTQPKSTYGSEIRDLLQLSDDASPAQLRGHCDKLKQIEDQLESA
jgi:hypothetical protein